MSRLLSFWLLVGVIVLLSLLFYRVMAGFLVPLFLAALLVVIFGPLHRLILRKIKGRKRTAAALTTLAVMLLVIIPFGLLGLFATLEGRDLIAKIDFNSMKQKTLQARQSLNLDIENEAELKNLDNNVKRLLETVEQSEIPSRLASIEEANGKLTKAVFDSTGGNSETQPIDSASGVYARKGARVQTAWEEYEKSLSEIATTLNRSSENGESVADQDPSDASTTSQEFDQQEYQVALIELSNSYRSFKKEMLGGAVLAWMKELANPSDEKIKTYLDGFNSFVQKHIFSIGGAMTAFVVKIIVGLVIMVISLYFFLLDGPSMIRAFKFLSPLNDEYEEELIDEFSRVSRAVVLATLLSAIAQGLLAGVGFYFAGLDSIFLLMLLSTALALIPFVGAASVWVPCCLWLYFIDGRLVAAIMLAIYGMTAISMIDNLIKPYVLHGQSNLHPLLALLSVLGGVAALGPVGILVGPMVVVFLQTLLKILQRELSTMDRDQDSTALAGTSN